MTIAEKFASVSTSLNDIRKGKTFPSWPQHGPEEEAALLRVLHSKKWGHGGTEVGAFEKAFAEYQQARYCVAMFNGSVTLRNALLACGLKAGDEVLVPPYTFLATASSVIEANCVPVFVDIDPETYCLDPAQIEKNIGPKTKAIIPVHLGGHSADMHSIIEIAQRHDLYVIEDCAHAHGAEFQGQKLGTLGHIGSFSFQASKNLCSGEGGAIVSNDRELAERCWSIHNCGRIKSGGWYQHEFIGGNYRMTEFQAALLSEQLKKLEPQVERRQANSDYLGAKLTEIPGIRPLLRKPYATRHGNHFFVFRFDPAVFGFPRQHFLDLLCQAGIPASAGYSTLVYEQSFIQGRNFGSFDAGGNRHDYSKVHCPVSEIASHEQGCWISQAALLGTETDMNDIVQAIELVYQNRQVLAERAKQC